MNKRKLMLAGEGTLKQGQQECGGHDSGCTWMNVTTLNLTGCKYETMKLSRRKLEKHPSKK